MDKHLIHIRDALVQDMPPVYKGDDICTTMNEQEIIAHLIPGFLSVTITTDCITVFYAEEHDEFWKDVYTTEEKWIDAARKHVKWIATSILTVDYYYEKKNKKLLYYKIWSKTGQKKRRLLKQVFVSTNPFPFFKPKIVVSKVLHTDTISLE